MQGSTTVISQSTTCIDIEFLSREHLKNLSAFWDIRNNKKSQRSPDFGHRWALWINDQPTSSWTQEKLVSNRAETRKLYLQESKESYCLKEQEVVEGDDRFRSLVASLKSCAKLKDGQKGSKIHSDAFKTGCLGKSIYVGKALLHLYSKCGALAQAQVVFYELPVRDVASWNIFIAGCAQHGLCNEVMNALEHMRDEGISPNEATFALLLKACGNLGSVDKGKEIHVEVVKQGLLEKNILIGTALVNMYSKCGVLAKACEVFDELPVRDAILWSVIISGYAQHGYFNESLWCFEKMLDEGITADSITFVCILKACCSIRALAKGIEIHNHVARQDLLGKDLMLGTALVDMYASCGAVRRSQEMFDELLLRNVICWNTLIAGYAQHSCNAEVLACAGWMQAEGVSLNAVTYVYVLKACGGTGALEQGEEIHFEVSKLGLLEKDGVLGNALLDMYGNCGVLAKSQIVFDKLPLQNVVSWNTLITGYVQHGHNDEALNCFMCMRDEGLSPDVVTYACILKACGNVRAAEKGKEIHAELCKQELAEKCVVLGTALVDMYVKCGALAKAREVFDRLSERDVVAWSALIAGHAQHGHYKETFEYFKQMQTEGLSADAIIFACILNAFGYIGEVKKGEEIHAEVERQKILEKDTVVGDALVDMYGRCGVTAKAQAVFDNLPVRDVVSWSTLISGYVQHGHNDAALNCFRHMQEEGIMPNAVTFVCFLKACGSKKAASKGKEIHAEVTRQGLLENNIVLGNALVDMYARCGMLVKAKEVFNELHEHDMVSWNALLAGYVEYGLVDESLSALSK